MISGGAQQQADAPGDTGTVMPASAPYVPESKADGRVLADAETRLLARLSPLAETGLDATTRAHGELDKLLATSEWSGCDVADIAEIMENIPDEKRRQWFRRHDISDPQRRQCVEREIGKRRDHNGLAISHTVIPTTPALSTPLALVTTHADTASAHVDPSLRVVSPSLAVGLSSSSAPACLSIAEIVRKEHNEDKNKDEYRNEEDEETHGQNGKGAACNEAGKSAYVDGKRKERDDKESEIKVTPAVKTTRNGIACRERARELFNQECKEAELKVQITRGPEDKWTVVADRDAVQRGFSRIVVFKANKADEAVDPKRLATGSTSTCFTFSPHETETLVVHLVPHKSSKLVCARAVFWCEKLPKLGNIIDLGESTPRRTSCRRIRVMLAHQHAAGLVHKHLKAYLRCFPGNLMNQPGVTKRRTKGRLRFLNNMVCAS